jgi:hypothetical protein
MTMTAVGNVGLRQRGTYVAMEPGTGLQVAVDDFIVEPTPLGWELRSRFRGLGGQGGVQESRWQLDPEWSPLALSIVAGGSTVSADFDDAGVSVTVNGAAGGSAVTRWPAPRRDAYFLMSGVLHPAMLLVRRSHATAFAPRLFQMVPVGACELRRVGDSELDGEPVHVLRAEMSMPGVTDVCTMYVDATGNLLRYDVRNHKMIIQLERP